LNLQDIFPSLIEDDLVSCVILGAGVGAGPVIVSIAVGTRTAFLEVGSRVDCPSPRVAVTRTVVLASTAIFVRPELITGTPASHRLTCRVLYSEHVRAVSQHVPSAAGNLAGVPIVLVTHSTQRDDLQF
jgi:hypothetical protein